MKRRRLYQLTASIAILVLLLTAPFPGGVQPAFACYTWAEGNRVGLAGGTQIRTGSGFGYPVHTTLPADANDWQVDIIDGPRHVDGQEWWDISRQAIDGGGTGWVYKAQAAWDVCQPPNPSGHVYVGSGLELVPDPNHAWPPVEGDKLIGRFTLGNDGNASLHLDGYGVRLRRNGSDYWDFLNNSGVDLGPGQTVRFDQNNERPLATGHYRAEITWKVAGQDWQVSHAQEFDVAARPSQGSIYVAEALQLTPDPAHAWPPAPGDKLVGRFRLGNNGGQSLHLNGFGVRLRRNGSEYWDFLNMAGADLGPGQTIEFNQNNERPLASGHYHAEITWQAAGGAWQVSHAQEFDVAAPAGSDAAAFISQSPYPTVPASQYFQVWFEVRNSGSSTWDSGYALINTNGQTLGAAERHAVSGSVGPQGTYRWTLLVQAPGTPGTYRTAWRVARGDAAFGPSMYIDVTVPGAAPGGSAADLRVTSGPTLGPDTLVANQLVYASFVVRNAGSTAASLRLLTLGGRDPTGAVEDFPGVSGLTIAPGDSYTFNTRREFWRDGQYHFFPVVQAWSGEWVELRGESGEDRDRYVTIGPDTTPAARSLVTSYAGGSQEVLEIRYGNLRPNADGSVTADIALLNRKQVALAIRFYDYGAPISDPGGITDHPFAVLPPSDKLHEALILRNVTFERDSHLHLMYSAWGTGGDDSKWLAVANVFTLLCLALSHEACPTTGLDFSLFMIEQGGELLAIFFPAVHWIPAAAAIEERDFWKFLDEVQHMLVASADRIASLLVRWLPGITGASVKRVVGTPLMIILTYPHLWKFGADVGGSKWWGLGEVDILPSDRPPTAAAVAEIETSLGEAVPNAVTGNQVVASSSEFGPGWEYYKLIDNSFGHGWGSAGVDAGSADWVVVQLAGGKPVSIQQVVIHPGPTGGDDNSRALRSFTVETSLNGMEFAPLLSGEFALAEVGAPKWFAVPGTLALYLRFRAASNQAGQTGSLLSVGELAVIGQVGSAGDGHEPDSHPSRAQALAVGADSRHSFSYAGDQDWTVFKAQAGSAYTLLTYDLQVHADTVIELYAPDGVTLLASDNDSGGGRASRLVWTAAESGQYYLKARQVTPVVQAAGMGYSLAIRANQTPAWYGEYYANMTLTGEPALVRQDPTIAFEWQAGSPGAGVPADQFSVRWTRTLALEAGWYTFTVLRDDGARLFVDDALILDRWSDGATYETVSAFVLGGNRMLRLEVYENGGAAAAGLSWTFVPAHKTYLPAIRN
jgi:hypothetical protein